MKCAICGSEFIGWGNNPYPIRTAEDARCCDDCNDRYVILGRLAMMGRPKKEALELAEMFNSWSFDKLNGLA